MKSDPTSVRQGCCALSDTKYQKHLVLCELSVLPSDTCSSTWGVRLTVLSKLPVDTCSSTWGVRQLCVESGSFIWTEKLESGTKILPSNSHS